MEHPLTEGLPYGAYCHAHHMGTIGTRIHGYYYPLLVIPCTCTYY